MSPVVLVILIAWALLSVMFLTGTLLAARSIDRSVAVIKPNVDQIGQDAGFIAQAKTIQGDVDEDPGSGSAAVRRARLRRSRSPARESIPKLKSTSARSKQDQLRLPGTINGTVLQYRARSASTRSTSSAHSINGQRLLHRS